MSISFSLPAGTSAQRFAVGATNSIDLRDRVRLSQPTASLGSVAVGLDAKTGSVTGKGNVTIKDRSRVTGDATAGGTLSVVSSAVVTGQRRNHFVFGPNVSTRLSFEVDSVSAGPVSLAPDAAQDIPPGRYSTLNMGSGSTVIVHSGVYLFTGNLTLEPQSVISVDSSRGPVKLLFQGDFTFRGAVKNAKGGIPQILFGKLGTGSVLLDASFTGALIAPQADVTLQAARPAGHEAIIYGKTVRAESDTVIDSYPFDWGGIDPNLQPPTDPNDPIVKWPESKVNLVVDITPTDSANGTGSRDSHVHTATPVTFSMPQDFPVRGGTIGNGTVTFTIHTTTGTTVVCTYEGGSPTATPQTVDDLNKGRTLHFLSCSDGKTAGTTRKGDDFTLHVDPADGYPVTVGAPVVADTSCSEEFEMLSPETATAMRTSFSVLALPRRPANNPDGTPTLYYGWILLKTPADALTLRKLYIHRLSRPLFKEELEKYAGRCGTFVNPGDSFGQWVPVLIPGSVINLQVDLIQDQVGHPFGGGLPVEGDRTFFEGIVIRDDVPAAARNPNGSVRLDVLKAAGFRYLSYEPQPLTTPISITSEGGAAAAVTRLVVSAVQWAGQAAFDVAHVITNILGGIDCLVRGCVDLRLHVQTVTHDPAFITSTDPEPAMVHGWGPMRGRILAAQGLRVTLLQSFLESPIPATSEGDLNLLGDVSLHAIQDGSLTGTGYCIELRNDAAVVTDQLIANELCDLRSLKGSSPIDTSRNSSATLVVFNPRLAGMVQADDAFQWVSSVVGFEPSRARILSGYWATIASQPIGLTPEKRLYATCFGFSPSIDEILADSLTGGILKEIFDSPDVAESLGTTFGGQLLNLLRSVLGYSDIVMPLHSKLPHSRIVMSHEYGHYIFCAMLHDKESGSLDPVIASAFQNDQSRPNRYINEAVADYIAGQVGGGADYGWTQFSFQEPGVDSIEDYNTPGALSFDDNKRGIETAEDGDLSIGRVATLIHDMFDGHGLPQTALAPNDADLWSANGAGDGLRLASPYGSTDANLELTALDGPAFELLTKDLAQRFAALTTFGANLSYKDIYSAASNAMVQSGAPHTNYCDRCRILALHSGTFAPGVATAPTIGEMFQHCATDDTMKTSLGSSPEPSGRIDAATCVACGPNQVSDSSGTCVACATDIQGNTCAQCPADIVYDGNTMPIDTEIVLDSSFSVAGDTCPGTFIVQLDHPERLFVPGRNAEQLLVGPWPKVLNQVNCTALFSVSQQREPSPGAGFVIEQTLTANGTFQETGLGPVCAGIPGFDYRASTAGTGTYRFTMMADPNKNMQLTARTSIIER